MKILYSDLIRKKVFTKNRDFVGYVNNLVFDVDTYNIISFCVSKRFFYFLFYNTINIDIKNIISITKEDIIIEDLSEKITDFNNKKIPQQLDVST